MRTERANVPVRARAAGEGGTGDIETMLPDRVEHPKAGVRTVSREQDDIDPAAFAKLLVQRQEFLGKTEGDARLQHIVLMLDLIGVIGVDALLDEHAMGLTQIEQGA
jgi:hypothetical protein